MQSVVAYCGAWHVHTSGAFHALLVEPLRGHANVEFREWDGIALPEHPPADRPLVFCQLAPPRAVLEDPQRKVIWLPMWDQVRKAPQRWWNRFPAHLRVVAYSSAIAQRTHRANLPTLPLRFHLNPAQFAPATWEGGRTLLYWNRTGLVGPAFLERFCAALAIKRLIFRPATDPEPAAARGVYMLPGHLGATEVTVLPNMLSHADYLAVLREANCMLAPRIAEGVGITILEAMSQGCAVFAFDAPTMNEYIEHNQSGYLLQRWGTSPADRALGRIRRASGLAMAATARLFRQPPSFFFAITEYQDWDAIRRIDLEQLGMTARRAEVDGFQAWQRQIPALVRFLLEW
jgi:hypothetical protein